MLKKKWFLGVWIRVSPAVCIRFTVWYSCVVYSYSVPGGIRAIESYPSDKLSRWTICCRRQTSSARLPARRVRLWQQRADYDINVELDGRKPSYLSFETIAYHNNSPDPLALSLGSNSIRTSGRRLETFHAARQTLITFLLYHRPLIARREFEGGEKIRAGKDAKGARWPYSIVRR